MKKSLKAIILMALAVIFITLIIIPVNLYSVKIMTGNITYYKGVPTCDCTTGAKECNCIIPELPVE
jgi:hypothetical protein